MKELLLVLFLAPNLLIAQQNVSIIPQPVSLQINQGSFDIDNSAAIKFNAANKELKSAADFFFGRYQKHLRHNVIAEQYSQKKY